MWPEKPSTAIVDPLSHIYPNQRQIGREICVNRLLVFAILAAASLSAKDEGFNGKWVIDKNASTATSVIPDNLTQLIKKKGDALMIETYWREPKGGVAPLALLGIMTTNLKLGMDGSEIRNDIGPFHQLSKTTMNGNQLVTDWTATVNGQNVKGQWTRTLSDDGKNMTLDIQEATEDGKSNSGKLVFKRK